MNCVERVLLRVVPLLPEPREQEDLEEKKKDERAANQKPA